MVDTAGLDPMSIEYCERTIEQLKSQKRKHSTMMTTKKLTESIKTNPNYPRTRKKAAEEADLLDAKKRAKEIASLDKDIKYLEKRKKCIIMAAERSIPLEAANRLIREEEERLKDEKKQQQQKIQKKPVGQEQPPSSASPESTVAGASPLPLPLPPPVHRYPPYPKGCDYEEYLEWVQEYDRVQDLNAATNNLPTVTCDHKDPITAAAVVDPDEKTMLIDVAKAIVPVSFPMELELHQDLDDLDGCRTGVIIGWDIDNKTARMLTCCCFGHDIDDDKPKRKIFVRWQYDKDAGLIEAKLLFFSTFYQLSLLEVAFPGSLLDVPTQIPRFGSSNNPKLGDEVFALGRNKDLSLVVRRGRIMQPWRLRELRQGYLGVGYELPACAVGGPVVDHHGDVVGLTMSSDEETSAVVLPISTALSCLHMWTEFGRIARPLLGMSLRNVEVVDGLSGDIRFDGLVVYQVDPNSAAWKHGIRSGNVIVSFDGQSPPKPLPEFEGFLLSCGLEHLRGTYKEVDFKLEVKDAGDVKRCVTLHLPFSDVANVLA